MLEMLHIKVTHHPFTHIGFFALFPMNSGAFQHPVFGNKGAKLHQLAGVPLMRSVTRAKLAVSQNAGETANTDDHRLAYHFSKIPTQLCLYSFKKITIERQQQLSDVMYTFPSYLKELSHSNTSFFWDCFPKLMANFGLLLLLVVALAARKSNRPLAAPTGRHLGDKPLTLLPERAWCIRRLPQALRIMDNFMVVSFNVFFYFLFVLLW